MMTSTAEVVAIKTVMRVVKDEVLYEWEQCWKTHDESNMAVVTAEILLNVQEKEWVSFKEGHMQI